MTAPRHKGDDLIFRAPFAKRIDRVDHQVADDLQLFRGELFFELIKDLLVGNKELLVRFFPADPVLDVSEGGVVELSGDDHGVGQVSAQVDDRSFFSEGQTARRFVHESPFLVLVGSNDRFDPL